VSKKDRKPSGQIAVTFTRDFFALRRRKCIAEGRFKITERDAKVTLIDGRGQAADELRETEAQFSGKQWDQRSGRFHQ